MAIIALSTLATLWQPLLALYGRWRRAVAWLGVMFAVLLVTTVTVYALPLVFLISIAGWIDAIRAIRGDRPERWRVGWAVVMLIAPTIPAFVLRAFAWEAVRNPSSSMCPTLRVGDRLFVEKLSKHWRAPARGDVIVFLAPDDRPFVKRVIAIGGDVVAIKGGVVWLDGKAVPTQRIADATYWSEDELDQQWSEEPATELEEDLDGRTHRVLRARGSGVVTPTFHDFPRDDPYDPDQCEDATPQRLPGHPRVEGWPVLATVPGGCRVPDDAIFVMGDNRDNSSDSRVWGPVPIDRVVGHVVGIWLPADMPSREWSRFGAID